MLRRAIGAARHKARTLLTQRMAARLSAPMRERLDALIAVDDDQPHSPLNRIKASSSSPSVGGMKRLLARLELIEATGVLGVDVGWVNGNYQRILFHSVRTASADRVRRMAAPRRHLALVCFLHQAWRDTLDQAVDMYGKLLDRNRKLVDERLDGMLKAQRHAVDRIVQRYRRLGAVLLDPDVADDELRARLLSTVPEAQLHEDDVVGRELAQVASRARHLEPPAVGLRAAGADLERHLAAGDLQAALAERDDERAGAGAVGHRVPVVAAGGARANRDPVADAGVGDVLPVGDHAGPRIDPLEDGLRVSEEGARLAIDLPEDAVLADGEERSAAAGVDQDLLEALVEVERLALADTAAGIVPCGVELREWQLPFALRGRPCYATSATKQSGGSSASNAQTKCRRSR